MNILIVAPRYKKQMGDFYDFPLGLAYISARIKQLGYRVHVLNLNHQYEPLDVLFSRWFCDWDIDVLCTGGLCVHYHQIKEILHEGRQVKEDLVTIVGGGIISAEPELMYENLELDYGVIGEGEITISELLETIEKTSDPGRVNGLVYRNDDGDVVKTPPRDLIEDLSSIPYPDYEGFNVEAYLDNQLCSDAYYLYPYDTPRALPVISSRSCPYRCTFCFHPLGNRYRRRPLDDFFGEVEWVLSTYGVNLLAIIDETLAASKGRIRDFCKRMKTYGVRWMTQLRVTAVDDEILGLLKDAGCYYISYGIESANNGILKSMQKHITIEQIDKALALTHKHGIGIQGNFLFSDKEETFETVCETMDWWQKHPQYHLHLNTLIPYPGSQAYHYCVEKGIIPDRLKYIETGCFSVNMSRMTNEVLGKVYGFLFEIRSNPKYRQFSKEVSVEMADKACVHRNVELVDLRFRCTQCGGENLYRNFMGYMTNYFKVACRHCNQRSDIDPAAFPIYQKLFENPKSEVTAGVSEA